MSLSLSQHKTKYIIQLCTSSISLTSSLAIVSMIASSPGKLYTPYRRLIFGLSMSDVIQSTSILLGPFSPPKGSPFAPWGFGNTTTCTIDGFALIFGSTSAAFYIMLLCVYSYCKMNLKMSNERFRKIVEVKAHLFIFTYTLSVCIVGIITKSFNPLVGGGTCYFARYPPYCGNIPEIVGECTRGFPAIKLYLASTLGVTSACFIVVMALMTLIIRNAIWTERVFRSNRIETLTTNTTRGTSRWSCLLSCGCVNNDHEKREDESEADYIIRLHRRETIIQTASFVTAFVFSYAALVISFLMGFWGILVPQIFKTISHSFLYPLCGLFNIFIYTRPKVTKLRLQWPEEISWIRAFFLVVKAGGEVPNAESDEFALSLCCKCCYNRTFVDGVSELSNPPQLGVNFGNGYGNADADRDNRRQKNNHIRWPLSLSSVTSQNNQRLDAYFSEPTEDSTQ